MEQQDDGVHDLTPGYAVDALAPDEAAAAEAHLAVCAPCRAELAEVREALAAALEDAVVVVPPPAALRERVMAALDDVPQLPALTEQSVARVSADVPDELALRRARAASSAAQPTSAGVRRPVRRRWVQGLAAAAAAVVVAGAAVTGYAAVQYREEAQASQQVARAVTEVAGAPDAQMVDAQGADGWGGTRVMVSRSLGEAVFVPTGVESAPSGHTWQLWFVSGGAARPAGTFSGAGSAAVLSGSVDGAEAVAVTLEPSGGSDAPTTTPVAVYPLTA